MNDIHGPGKIPPPTPNVDATALAWELRGKVRGEVRFDTGSRALYATDASNYRQVPIGVVVPRDVEDVIATVEACRQFQAPVLSRGGGTSLAGQCCNVAVVLDFSKYMNRVLEVDVKRQRARVQPGVVLDHLRAQTLPHHLTFAPDPSTHNHCTLGGMIGNNSCGVHSVLGGRTVDNVHALDVLCYDGTRLTVGETPPDELERRLGQGGRIAEIYQRLATLAHTHAELIRARYPDIPRRVSGYSLDELLPERGFHVARSLVGSEGTCVVVLEAEVRLMPWPKARSLLVLGYPDIYQAGDHVMEVLEAKPIGLEGVDDCLLSDMKKLGMRTENLKLLPPGQGFLLVEFGGEHKRDADAQAHRLMERLRHHRGAPSMALFDDPKQEEMLWKVRESGLGATAHIPGEPITWEGWEDAAVRPERLGAYLRQFRALLDRYGYRCSLYGHFGQACVHTRIEFDLATRRGIDHYRAFTREAAALVLEHGGSLSGEHGDGQSRGELLPMMFGPELMRAMRDFKGIWDPQWRMNPGKKIAPARQDEHLRLGTDFHPWRPDTFFRFPKDGGDVAHAALRCVGIGECRRDEKGTMCPSYRVTREEMHSTRGRAHLFFEMLNGKTITDGWRSQAVKESLDLCLACKGCKGDCPVNVDLATYKAEFLAHHYRWRLRPRSAYAFGHIDRWARLAAHAPRLVNALTHAPGLARLAKAIAGVAPEREIPRFAPEPFTQWFRRRPAPAPGHRPRVILWPDTFTNYFEPAIPQAAVAVLEASGYQVDIPRTHLCCGRPLYDYGFLATAKRYLTRIMDHLRADIRAGTWIVGLEPSCIAVFRDELVNLFPFDEDAQRLSQQTLTLAELLVQHTDAWQPPRIARRAVVHGHCHHHAVMGFEPEQELVKACGLQAQVLDAGCCGMAGSFGFETAHYDLSAKVGELKLLPAVRAAAPEELLIADGFSCRHQIQGLTGRACLHLAQVLAMGLPPTGTADRVPAAGERL